MIIEELCSHLYTRYRLNSTRPRGRGGNTFHCVYVHCSACSGPDQLPGLMGRDVPGAQGMSFLPCTGGCGLPSLVALRGAGGFLFAAGCASYRVLPVVSLSCQGTCPGLRCWWFWHQGCWTSPLTPSLDSTWYCLRLPKVRLQSEVAPEVHRYKKSLKKKT